MIYDFPNNICPNCYKEMIEIKYEIPVDKNTLKRKAIKYVCPFCNIIAANSSNVRIRGYSIPNKYLPTEKQIKTIGFINSKMHLGLKAITKKQSIEIIDKYFDIAKNDNISTSDCTK